MRLRKNPRFFDRHAHLGLQILHKLISVDVWCGNLGRLGRLLNRLSRGRRVSLQCLHSVSRHTHVSYHSAKRGILYLETLSLFVPSDRVILDHRAGRAIYTQSCSCLLHTMPCTRKDTVRTLGCALGIASQHGLHAGETVERVLSMILVGQIAIQSGAGCRWCFSRLKPPRPPKRFLHLRTSSGCLEPHRSGASMICFEIDTSKSFTRFVATGRSCQSIHAFCKPADVCR